MADCVSSSCLAHPEMDCMWMLTIHGTALHQRNNEAPSAIWLRVNQVQFDLLVDYGASQVGIRGAGCSSLCLPTLRMAALVDHLSLITNLLIEANGFSAIFYRQQEEGRRMRPTRNYLCQQVCSFHYSAPQGKICLLRGILVVTEECLLAVLFNRSFLHSLTQTGDVNHELM